MKLELLSGEPATRLLTTLGHSLWQGAAATALLYVVLALLPARRAQARYLAALTCLLLLALAPLVTWSFLAPPPGQSPPPAMVSIVPSEQALATAPSIVNTTAVESVAPATPAHVPFPWRTYLVIAWLFGVGTGLIRLFSAVTGARRLRRASHAPSPTDLAWLKERLAALADRLQVRGPVEILLNPELAVPAVCGLFRPVILIPTALITGLPPAHLEAVLAHELAHIRRHDYLVNLAQMTLEALLFFNPFVWWISRQVRLEREAFCDALAIAATGAPGYYARVLAQVAEQAMESRAPLPAALPAMSGPKGERGQLIERVRRVLRPGDRPGLRLSWPATVTFLAISFVTLAALHFTTSAAVELLSPQQRIDKVAEIQKEYRPFTVTSVEAREKKPSDREITVKGRVVTADGEPLPKRTNVCTIAQLGTHSSSAQLGVGANGEFSEKDKVGSWKIHAYAPGYAMAVLDLGEIDEDRSDNVLTLEKGYSSTLRILDTDRRPIAGMKVKARYDSNCSSPATENYTGADGVVELTNLAAFPMSVEADLPGFEHGEWKVGRLEPGKVLDLIMDKSIPVRARVLAAETGQPIAGAELKIVNENRGRNDRSLGLSNPPLATTSADGGFTLDTLRSDTSYFILVTSPGYQWHLIRNVISGKPLDDIKLSPSKTLTVEVRGIDTKRKKVELEYCVTLKFDSLSNGMIADRFSELVQDGVARFSFPVLMNTETEFRVGRTTRDMTWEELNQDTLVWDLTPPPAEAVAKQAPAPLQPVEITLKSPDKLPPAQGQLVVTHKDAGSKYHTDHVYPVKDGVVRLEVPVPNKLYFEPEGVQGYWFGNVDGKTIEALHPDPVRVEIPVLPAGAIYGSLTLADGSPGRGIMLSAIVDPAHKVLKGRTSAVEVKNQSSPDDESSRFYAGPLPLGGKFTICASRGATYIFSKALQVDEKTPIHELNLRFPAGETVRGRIVAEDGTPARGAPLTLQLVSETTGNRGIDAVAVTGRQGEFEIAGLNRDVPGTYWVEADRMTGYQPAKAAVEFGKEVVVRVKPGYAVRGIAREAGTVKVIPRVVVYATRPDYKPDNWPNWINASKLADENGRFMFTDLPEGQWEIRTRSGNMDNWPVVEAGAKEDVILEIKLLEGSDLKPVDQPK